MYRQPTPPQRGTTPGGARLLSSKQAAKYLAISERKLWQLSKDGRLPKVNFDHVVRYDPTDLENFILKAKEAQHE